MTFFSLFTILCIGLMIGVEVCVSIFINPVLSRLDERPRAIATALFAARLGKAMPFWYAVSLLCLIVQAVLHRAQQSAMWMLISAAALWVAIIIFTLVALVPINNRIAALDPASLPPDWDAQHDTWDARHRARVIILIVSFVLALYAILS
jgi:uncharacterized membrane protein